MAYKRAKESFAFSTPNGMATITAGQLVDTDTFDISGKESLFEDVETYVARQEESKKQQAVSAKSVESATAAPGEKRTVSTPLKGRRIVDG
jgi:hypothetical protein